MRPTARSPGACRPWIRTTATPSRARAPVGGKIIIGFSGEDFGSARGYVTAYDAETGKLDWRFYTVPGKPGTHYGAASDSVMDMAAKTWTGQWWKRGGGGAAWSSMTYDPEFNRVYIGTGNGDPMNWKIRSPGGGDNLFIASIVALDADTGHYVWHYQTTPGDAWDYDAATDMTLATLSIDGRPQGPAGCAEERVLLRDRPGERQAALRPTSSAR